MKIVTDWLHVKPKKKNNSISRTNDNVIINIGVKQIDAEFPMIWIALNVNKKISRGYTQWMKFRVSKVTHCSTYIVSQSYLIRKVDMALSYLFVYGYKALKIWTLNKKSISLDTIFAN